MSGMDNTSYTTRTTSATSVTLNNNDYVLILATLTGATTVNLPAVAAIQPGRMYTIKRDASAQTVTIDGFGSETINGGTTLALGASGTAAAVVLVSDSTQWHIVSNA